MEIITMIKKERKKKTMHFRWKRSSDSLKAYKNHLIVKILIPNPVVTETDKNSFIITGLLNINLHYIIIIHYLSKIIFLHFRFVSMDYIILLNSYKKKSKNLLLK